MDLSPANHWIGSGKYVNTGLAARFLQENLPGKPPVFRFSRTNPSSFLDGPAKSGYHQLKIRCEKHPITNGSVCMPYMVTFTIIQYTPNVSTYYIHSIHGSYGLVTGLQGVQGSGFRKTIHRTQALASWLRTTVASGQARSR